MADVNIPIPNTLQSEDATLSEDATPSEVTPPSEDTTPSEDTSDSSVVNGVKISPTQINSHNTTSTNNDIEMGNASNELRGQQNVK